MAISLDATSQGDTTSGTTLTVSHTCTGSDRLLVVVGTTWAASVPGNLSCTYDGVSMTAVADVTFMSGNAARVVQWYLAAPATGANNVVVTNSVSGEITMCGISYTGAHQTDFTGASGNNKAVSVNTDPTLSSALSSDSSEICVSTLATWNATIAADSPLTEQVENSNGSPINSAAIGDRAGAASTATDWTLGTARHWGIISKCYLEAAAATAAPRLPLLGVG